MILNPPLFLRAETRSPERTGLRKGDGRVHGARDICRPSPSPHPGGAPPHRRTADSPGPEVHPSGSCVEAGRREQGGRAARAPPRGGPESLTATRGGRHPLRGPGGTRERRDPQGAYLRAAPSPHLPSPPGKGDTAGTRDGSAPAAPQVPRPRRGPAPGGAPPLLSPCLRLSGWPRPPSSCLTPYRSSAWQLLPCPHTPLARWGGSDPGTWGPFLIGTKVRRGALSRGSRFQAPKSVYRKTPGRKHSEMFSVVRSRSGVTFLSRLYRPIFKQYTCNILERDI